MRRSDPDAIRMLVLDFIRADDAFRRDLGAFGQDDYRTIYREQARWQARQNLRSWYVHTFGSADLATLGETTK